MRSVNFDNPYLLLLAIPLLLLVVIPFIIAIRKENRQKSAVASLSTLRYVFGVACASEI